MHWYMQRSQTIHTQFHNALPFPVICCFSDFTAFGLREAFEFQLAQWSWPGIITSNSYTDHSENLEEQRLKRYT